jgi:hypothetical protein
VAAKFGTVVEVSLQASSPTTAPSFPPPPPPPRVCAPVFALGVRFGAAAPQLPAASFALPRLLALRPLLQDAVGLVEAERARGLPLHSTAATALAALLTSTRLLCTRHAGGDGVWAGLVAALEGELLVELCDVGGGSPAARLPLCRWRASRIHHHGCAV